MKYSDAMFQQSKHLFFANFYKNGSCVDAHNATHPHNFNSFCVNVY